MDIIDEVAGVKPIDLNDFIEERPLEPLAPEASIRNRAAHTALLSDNPKNISSDYQAMVKEGLEGKDDTRQLIKSRHDARTTQMTQGAILQILADRNTSDEQKKAAIAAINSQDYQDTSYNVAMNAAAVPAKETERITDARITAAETFREIKKYKEEKQAMMNSFTADLDPEAYRATSELLEMLIPFATNKQSASMLLKMKESLNIEKSNFWDTLNAGSTTSEIRDALARLPLNKRTEAERLLLGIIKNNSKIFFRNDNDFAKFQKSQDILGEDTYGPGTKFLDNISGYLDIIGLGGVSKAIIGYAKGISKGAAASKRGDVALRTVADNTAPVAPLNTIAEVSPDKARDMYKLVVQTQADEVAQALTGTDRTSAVAGPVLPQPATASGAVESKVINIDAKLYDEIVSSGANELTEAEKAAINEKIVNITKGGDHATLHDNMVSIGNDGNRTYIDAVYGAPDGAFSSAREALDNVKFTLKDFGVTDENLTLLKREGGEYVPAKLEDVDGIAGNYLVKYKGDYTISGIDVESFENFKVRFNLLDSSTIFRSRRQGTPANHLMTHSSMLDPRIVGPAITSVDKSAMIDKLFIKLIDDWAKPMSKLSKDRQTKIDEYFKEANHYGFELDATSLTGRGFTKDEIAIIQKHRQSWDTAFFFENRDLNRSLTNQGYLRLENTQGDMFIAKPVKQKNGTINNVYDPDAGRIVSLSKQELDDLYNNGGYYGKLRTTENILGQDVDHIVVRNTPNSYLRRIKDTDQTLEYRKGYYQVHYEAPIFIDQILKNSNGVATGVRTVGMAGDTAEAHALAKSKGLTQGDYTVRNDKNAFRVDSETYWDLQNSHGRIAQRHRGQRLQELQAPPGGFDSKYIANPIDSAVRAARSLSTRIAMRDVLDTIKQRATQQYGDLWTKNGIATWPSHSNDIAATGQMTGKRIRDARTTIEYVNYLERGYVNGVDEFYKGMVNVLANAFGEIGLSKSERAAIIAGKASPAANIKEATFHALIGTNPIRQIIVQAMQASRLSFYNPGWIVSGRMVDDLNALLKSRMFPNLPLTAKEKSLVDFVNETGMLAAVDRSNLVRGAISDMALSGKPLQRMAGKALAIPRILGFDAGERTNLILHMLSVRDEFIKKGKNVDLKSVRDEIHSQARAISGDMNFAGDMPYNQNWASILGMYMQVPIKMLSTVTSDRRIPLGVKAKLASHDLIMYGLPGSLLVGHMLGEDILPENPIARELVTFGALSAGINLAFSKMFDKEVNADFSSLNPYQMEGWGKMIEGWLEGGVVEMFNSTPAANVFWKEGGKVREAVGKTARYFGVIDRNEKYYPEEILDVMKAWLSISSGASNYQKAALIMETGKLMDRNGTVFNANAGWAEAALQLAGFGSQEQMLHYYVKGKIQEGTKAEKEEVQKWVKDVVRTLVSREHLDNRDDEFAIKVLGVAKLQYANDPQKLQLVYEEIKKLNVDVKTDLYQKALRYGGIKGSNEIISDLKMRKLINSEEENKLIQVFEDVARDKQQSLEGKE